MKPIVDKNYSSKVIENLPDWKKKLLKKQFGLTNKSQRKNLMKPIKAWAKINNKGKIRKGLYLYEIFSSKGELKSCYPYESESKIIRVEIREVGK